MGLLRRFAPRNDSKQVNRLRNKCVMTGYGHAELVSVSCGLNPSPAFQAPSAQGRQGHTHRTALRFPLSPQVARGKIRSVGNMKENIFSNMVNSLFTTHHSLIHTDMVFSLFTSHLKHPLLIQTLHSLILNTKKNELVSKLVFKFFNVVLNYDYSIILSTTPAPTVWPPSRIANLIPSSIATGAISSTSITTLSPGITI